MYLTQTSGQQTFTEISDTLLIDILEMAKVVLTLSYLIVSAALSDENGLNDESSYKRYVRKGLKPAKVLGQVFTESDPERGFSLNLRLLTTVFQWEAIVLTENVKHK